MKIFSTVPFISRIGSRQLSELLETGLYADCGRMVITLSEIKTCQRLFDFDFEPDDGP